MFDTHLMDALAHAAQTENQTGGLDQMIPLIVIMALAAWFLLIRPEKKRQRETKEREAKLDALKKGDRIVTVGGVHGKVTAVDKSAGTLTVEVAPKVPVRFSRNAVATVETKNADEKTARGASDADSEAEETK